MVIGTFDTNLIPSTSIREYFEEILANYLDGHTRSAIVLLYSTVVTDIMQKLYDLSNDYNDADATSILQSIQQKKQSNPKDPSWENDVVADVLSKNIVDSITVQKIQQLQQQRHLSAHPALNQDYELFKPSQATVYDYISFMYENLFTRPAPFLGNIVDKMTDDLSNYACCLATDPKSLEDRILEKYVKRCRDNDFKRIFKAYWKFVFKKDSAPQVIQDRPLNFFVLLCLTKYGSSIVTQILQEGKVFDNTCSEKDFLDYLTKFFEQYPEMYSHIPDVWKNIIKGYAYDNPNSHLKAWYVSSMEQHIDSLLQKGFIPSAGDITEESFKQFYDKYKLWNLDDKVILFYINLLGYPSKFAIIDNIFDRAVKPLLKSMTPKQFDLLLTEMNQNDQVYNNRNKSYMVNQVKIAYNQKFGTQLNLQSTPNLA